MSVIGNVIYAGGGTGGVGGLGNCLTFTSLGPFSLEVYDHTKHWDGTLEWTDGEHGWKTWNGTTVLSASSGFLALRGTGNSVITGKIDSGRGLALTGSNIRCDGNIETLLDYATVAAGNHPQMGNSCFEGLFYGCANLISAPSLPATTLAIECYRGMFCYTSLIDAPALPATTLKRACYFFMFSSCTSLTTAPALPATTLAVSCYRAMFQNCASLTTTPALPVTTLASNCYQDMFKGCTSLTNVPALPATALESDCYNSMFSGCTSLENMPVLPATTIANSCYQEMFRGCTSMQILPILSATTLKQACYYRMFQGCTSIRLSQSQSGDYQYAYRIPTTGTGTTASIALDYMFYGTGGTFTETPDINTTYYTTNPPIG